MEVNWHLVTMSKEYENIFFSNKRNVVRKIFTSMWNIFQREKFGIFDLFWQKESVSVLLPY